MPRLRRVDCSRPGMTRRRAGSGFVYLDVHGQRVTDEATLARIRALAIPPAWADVWICPWPNGHIQAVGTDAKGRRQYRYHDEWRRRRDQEKFDHMLDFGRVLPDVRAACLATLNGSKRTPAMTRERVLACSVRLLDLGFFRIGTEGYAEENQHYGLATIRKDHVKIDDGVVTFDYVAKSGKRRIQSIVDPDVCRIVVALKRRQGGGPELLAYRKGSAWCDVKSHDINAYIKSLTGADFTAKDFRTWSATVLAAVSVAVAETVTSPTGRKRVISWAVQEVAHYLGNTPAVCRSSYIDPRVFDHYQAGATISAALARLGESVAFGQLSTQGAIEDAVLDLLSDTPVRRRAAA